MSYLPFPSTVPGPSYPVDKQAQPKVKRANFGDSYTQQYPDGINYNLYSWSLTWENLTETEKNTIETFLVARKGLETFEWTDNTPTTYRVKAPTWTISEIAPKVYTIKVTFNQSPL
jgi:phage-related protein